MGVLGRLDEGDTPPCTLFLSWLCRSESPLWRLLARSPGWVGCEGGRQVGGEAYFS